MQTTKLISSVSYNTDSFLFGTIKRLVEKGLLEYGYWIKHKAEADEKKDHIHFVVKPNRRLDTSALRNEFIEPVPNQPPLGVLPFRSTSRMSDWILYSAHDTEYLIRKGQTREHHYDKRDFHSTEPDLFEDDWRDCHEHGDNKTALLAEYVRQGKTWSQVVKMGFLPINQLFQYKEIFFLLCDTELPKRNGHPNHETVS